MARPVKDKVEAAFKAIIALEFDEQIRLDAMIRGYRAAFPSEPKAAPKPRAPKAPKTPEAA